MKLPAQWLTNENVQRNPASVQSPAYPRKPHSREQGREQTHQSSPPRLWKMQTAQIPYGSSVCPALPNSPSPEGQERTHCNSLHGSFLPSAHSSGQGCAFTCSASRISERGLYPSKFDGLMVMACLWFKDIMI